jgi:hypothetical protein
MMLFHSETQIYQIFEIYFVVVCYTTSSVEYCPVQGSCLMTLFNKIISFTSVFPEVDMTLKPMYPKALRTTIGATGRLIPWGRLGGGVVELGRLVLNLL